MKIFINTLNIPEGKSMGQGFAGTKKIIRTVACFGSLPKMFVFLSVGGSIQVVFDEKGIAHCLSPVD